MLEVAKASKEDVLVDLGCGDGRILATAVKDFGVRSASGYEIREDLFKTASGEVEKLNLTNKIHIYNRDLFQADLKDATLITLYLTTYANERLKPKLRAEARPGSRIVSHDFMINGWKPSKKENFNEHTIYVYSIPESYSM
jgi:tRNA A58 N-methylase Trm61